MSWFRKNKQKELFSPVTGTMIPLKNVPDKVFAEKLMGDGIAFELESNIICAPCDGKIVMIASTLHAIGIQADNGAEILIHIGLDTVNLGGQGFKTHTASGKAVKTGDPLIEIDMQYMKENNAVLTTPMIITNCTEYPFNIEEKNVHVIMGESKVLAFQ